MTDRNKQSRNKLPGVPCPDCNHKMRTTGNSKQLTPVFKEITYACTNELCGGVIIYDLTPSRRVSPSAIPNLDIHIPLSQHIDVQGLLDFLKEPSIAKTEKEKS